MPNSNREEKLGREEGTKFNDLPNEIQCQILEYVIYNDLSSMRLKATSTQWNDIISTLKPTWWSSGVWQNFFESCVNNENKEGLSLIFSPPKEIKVDINQYFKNSNKTALHVAIEKGSLEMVKILVEHKADIKKPLKREKKATFFMANVETEETSPIDLAKGQHDSCKSLASKAVFDYLNEQLKECKGNSIPPLPHYSI